jgi:hypothetical protein
VENASLNGKSNNFPQGAIYLVLRNNTDKLIRSGSFGDLASFSMSLGMFISSNGSQSRIAVKDSPNATEVYLNILIKPGETVERYFYPLSDISIGDKQFSLILNFQTYEMPTEEPLKDLSEFPPEERQKEFMRRFMAAPTQPITNNYSIRLDFTQVEQ